jgi:hypothetical protein
MENTFKRIWKAATSALVLVALCALPALAQNYPPTWVYARDYNYSAVQSAQANTYTFNGPGSCAYSPTGGSVNGYVLPIFDFSGSIGATTVYFPVAIVDQGSPAPTTSEVVTPSSTTNGATTCGFSATTVNSHTTFALQSGTAGLQEAIVYQAQTTPVFDVVLDREWYQLAAAITGYLNGATPSQMIYNATGNANVGIVDTTTEPWTWYAWNGSHYVVSSSTGGIEFTSLTAASAPTALTTVAATCATNGGGCISTSTTGGSIPASGAYTLGATYVTALGGETTLSTDTAAGATVTVGSTTTNTITVTSPAAETGAVGWRVYMTAASGASLSEILYASSCASASTGQIVLNGVCAIGSNATITAIITGTATVPATNTAFLTETGSTSPLQSLVSYPPFSNLATISAGATGTLATVNLWPAAFNTLGRHLHVHGTGFGTTNGTAGTLTFAIKLASVPGVTSVTPFTAVSGTTTGSAVVNFTFDVDITTNTVGTSGKLETHGTVCYNLAGTAVCSPAQDLITAAGSAINLTTQDQLEFTLTPTTTAITTGGAQIRQLTLQWLQ